MDAGPRTPLFSEAFAADPQVTAAKRDLIAALGRHQEKITGVRPPHADRRLSYAETIKAFSRTRGGKLFFPFLASGIGRGPLVELADGSVKFDLINGIGVHHFGHSHPSLVEAAIDAALGDTVMLGNLQQNEVSFSFSRKLLAAANAGGALPQRLRPQAGAVEPNLYRQCHGDRCRKRDSR